MTLKELSVKLSDIMNLGYVKTQRSGSTGVGYTFESLMGLSESNIPIPDLGGIVELKTSRKDSSSLVTLFTFNKGAWKVKQKEVIEKFGYRNGKHRFALKSTVFYGRRNSLGFLIDIDSQNNFIRLGHQSNQLIAEWDLFEIVGKFSSKMRRLLLVLASRRGSATSEEFFYDEVYLLTDPDVRHFLQGFRDGLIGIDLRMHLKPNGSVRNRGTGFRMREADLKVLYKTRKQLL